MEVSILFCLFLKGRISQCIREGELTERLNEISLSEYETQVAKFVFMCLRE